MNEWEWKVNEYLWLNCKLQNVTDFVILSKLLDEWNGIHEWMGKEIEWKYS